MKWMWKSLAQQNVEKIMEKEESPNLMDVGWENVCSKYSVGTQFEYLGVTFVVNRIDEEELSAEYYNHVTGKIETYTWIMEEYDLILKAFIRK